MPSEMIDEYINVEQQNTADNLNDKVYSILAEPENDIVIKFDGSKLTNDNFQFITQLPLVLKDSGEVGSMQYDIFEFEIKSLKAHEKELVVNENTMFNTN